MISAATIPLPPPTSSAGPANGKVVVATPSSGGTGGPSNANKGGGNNNKGMRGNNKKLQPQRRHSPPTLAPDVIDRAHSVDGSCAGPVPLRRASYAFDHSGGGHRHNPHQKSSTPPYHPHHHHLHHQQNHTGMNGALIHQHSAPPLNASTHHQDSSDCGSSSGLGGMGTPIKGGESGCSISSSSNNSVIADCSHDSRDSGGPISSPGTNQPPNADSANGIGGGQQNGHRSLVATATLTQSMVSSQPMTTTISPVSSIPTLVQPQPQPIPNQPQIFSSPPPGIPPIAANPTTIPPPVAVVPSPHPHHQFGAFIAAAASPSNGQQQPQQSSSSPSIQNGPQHLHSQQPQHFQPNGMPHPHPNLLPQQQHFHHPAAAAAVAQFNALQAAVAAAAMLPPTANPPNGHQSGATAGTSPIPLGAALYDGGRMPPPAHPQRPPQQSGNPQPHWNASPPQQNIGGQKQQQMLMPNEIGNQQQQQQMGMGRALYTMTCETAALASVGAAAVTAGYHVTLEPCASAPPIIPPSGPVPSQQTPTVEDGSQSPPSQKPQCTPPPGFQQQSAAGGDGAANAGSEENDGNAGSGGNQQQQSGDQPSTGSGEGGMPVPMNGPSSNGGGQPQSQQISNGPLHPPGSTNAIMPPGVPPEIAAAISGGHDLFVHIHPGDAIALAVGNEIQHIHGPATIRMVSQSVPPSAIPMNVPQGHIVQQLLDRQGYLSHIIMSQEMPPMAAPTPPGPSMGQAQIGGQQTGPGQQRHPHQLQPHHHQPPPPIHQSSPSPQKSNTPAGRYRPSPSSSASPPNQAHHAQHQQFVLPPGYEQQSHQPPQQHHPNQQFLTGEGPNAGYAPSPNPLNKWSPSPRGGGNHQNYYGGRRGMGAGGQMAGPSNALGTFYIEPVSQQLIAASQSSSGAFIHQPHGQQILIATEQPPPDYSGQQIPPPQGHQQAQHFAGTPLGGPGPMIPLGPFVPGGTGHHPVGAHPVEVVPMSIEEDEKERLRDALSALPSPMVTRVGDRDADVVWQELDTSEAAASVPGFPEINQSEFTYQLILYEQNASTSVFYKTDANSGNVLHLQRLRPATDYMVCIRADLPGHSIIGHPSNYTAFRTHSSRPDPPIMPKLLSRHPTACSLQWRTPNCNGAPILAYCLQMAKGKSGPFDTLVYEGPQEQTTINGLEPSGLYRFRLFCRNEIGQSDYSPQLNVYPDRGSSNAEQRGGGGPPHSQHFQHHPAGQQPPQHLYGGPKGQQGSMASSPCSSIQQHPPPQAIIAKPPPPNVHSVMAKTIKMSWNDVQPGHEYLNVTLELSDFSIRGTPHFAPIPMECYAASGTFATLGGLQPNRDYRFRLAVNTANGDTLHSDFVAVRTRSLGNEPQSHYKEHRYEPQQPERNIEKAQLSAEYEQEPQSIESQQHHRGSPAAGQQQHKFGGQQKRSVAGSTQSSQSKKGQQTQTSKGAPPQPQQIQQQSVESEEAEIVKTTLKPKEQQQLPQQPQKPQINGCSTPKFTLLTSESAKVTWRLITPGGGGSPKKGNSLDGQNGAAASSSGNGQNAAMMFELQRVDRQQPQIVFSGNETEFELKGLKPVEHLQLRVRAVLLDTEGKRFEGEWSQVGSACTLSAAPTAPRNVRPLQPESPTTASGNQSGAEEEETRSKKSSASHGPTHSGHSIAICWDPPAQINGAQITEYTVHAQRFALDDLNGEKALEERLLGSSSEPQFQTPRLQAANRYLLYVCAHNEAGASPRSEPPFEYLSPPSVPDPPRDFHAEALSTSELQLSWSEPAATNGAPITSFHLNCFKLYNTRNLGEFSASGSSSGGRHRQLVSQQIVPGSQRLVLVQSLETETDYELVLQAENAVGKSAREHLRCATLAEPPNPPEMSLAQATANTLKLKWNAAGDSASSANHYYYLERENENGTYSPVYEGDLRTAKVKGLRERSTHHFRIRAAVAKGLMLGPWSKRFSYQTTRQPPPAPKQAPIATELTADLFQLEWPANRSKEASAGADEQCEQADEQQQFIYRIQLAPKATTSAKEKSAVEVWKTIYEGTSTQCTIPVPNASQQARQARLFIVQQFLGPDGQLVDECASAPSPITVFSSQKTPNESPKKRPLQGGKNAQSPSTSTGRGRQQQNPFHYPTPKEPAKMTVYKRLKRFGSWMKKTVSEKDCALIVLFIFVILAFGIAILLNNYYLN